MFIKKVIISNLMKINVSHSMPGRIRLKIAQLKDIPQEYRIYEKYILDGVRKLDGINEVEVNYITGSVLIKYDDTKLYEKKILAWIDILKKIAIKNMDEIEKYGETNTEHVVSMINRQLDDELKKI